MEITVQRIISYSCCTFLSLLPDSSVRECNLGKPGFVVNKDSHLLLKDIIASTNDLRCSWKLQNPKHFLIFS